MSRRLGRLVAVALAALTLTTGTTALPATAAPPVTPVPPPAVTPLADGALLTVTSVSPVVVTASTSVTMTGTVTAPATTELAGARVRLVRSDSIVNTRDAVAPWLDGTGAAAGSELGSVPLPTMPAGTTRAFTITVPEGTVRSARPFAAIPVSLEVAGGTGGPVSTTGITTAGGTAAHAVHTFLAWHGPRKEYEQLSLSVLVPLTLPPELDLYSRDAGVRQAAWREAIGPGSRIRGVVDATAGSPVVLAVDPSLLGPPGLPGDTAAPETPGTGTGTPSETPSETSAPATTTATPTRASTATPSPTPTTTPTTTPAEPSLQSLTDGLVELLRGRTIWALPYADADVAAAASVAPDDALVGELVGRAGDLAARLGSTARSDIAWPVDGLLPAGREDGLAQLWTTGGATLGGIVVGQPAVTDDSPYTPTARRATDGGLPLLAADPALSASLPTEGGSVALATQAFLADTLVLLGERPGTPRSVFVAPSRDWQPDPAGLPAFLAALTQAPWLARVDAASLLTDTPDDPVAAAETPAAAPLSAAPPPLLSATRLGRLADQRDTILRVSTVLRDRAAFERTYRELLDELTSARWRWAPDDWDSLYQDVAAEVRGATSAIRVIPREVNFLAETGSLQVTVENGLGYAIEDIRLVIQPTNPRMQVVEQPEALAIGPNSRATVLVPMRAVAAGRADVRAVLTTSEGTQIGRGAVIPVFANPLDAQIYWIAGIAVGLVLVLGVARAIVRGTSRIDEIGELPEVEGLEPHTAPRRRASGGGNG